MHLDQAEASRSKVEAKVRAGSMQRLEVEGEDERQKRLQRTFQKLNAESSLGSLISEHPTTLPDLRSEKIKPPHELLSRVQAFLPQMEAANALLAKKDPESWNIENLSVGEGQYIEMNLGLGVFEDTSNKDMDADMQGASSSSSSSSESSDEEDGYSTDQSSEIITCFTPGPRPIKPLPRRSLSRPQIIVLEDEKADSSSSSSS